MSCTRCGCARRQYEIKTEHPRATILGGEVRTLHSTAVGDDYEIAVWLPPSYATSSQQYPTLYVLDAAFTFSLTW